MTEPGVTIGPGARASSRPVATVGPEAEALARELGLSFTVAEALRRMGFGADERTARFLAPKLAELTLPDTMAGRATAVARLGRAVRERELVVVFGDYDCDGITATAILTEALRALGGQVQPLVASRFRGGYGLSDPALDAVCRLGPRLLVTCDCGSSDQERVRRATAAGIDVVVVDHHLVPTEPLDAVAFINPQQPGCGHPYKHLASCGLVLMLVAGLRRELDAPLDWRRWLDLVAIGTVADVAPLDGDNRILVHAGLAALGSPARVGLRALLDRLRRGRQRPVTADDVGYQIGPRLNAPGRLGDPTIALELLIAQDPVRASALAAELDEIGVARRRLQATTVAEALADVAAGGWAGEAAVVVARPGWHPGIVGIVAGRLAAALGRPTAVVALDGDRGRGSARAPAGFPLYDSLALCADRLLGFGGHQAAAGLEIRAADVASFRADWAASCAAIGAAPERWLAVQQPVRVALDPRDDLSQVVDDLERIEPCGHGNPAPLVVLSDVRVRSARDLQGHLRLDLEAGGNALGGFAPNRGPDAPGLSGARVGVVGKLRRDHFHGGNAVELLVEELVR